MSWSELTGALSAYPRWFVVCCLSVVAILVLWVVGKVLKWGFYLMAALVALVGVALAISLLLN